MRRWLLILIIPLLAVGCNKSSNSFNNDYQNSSSFSSSSSSVDQAVEEPVVENPYDEDSGHSAGYNWAENTGGDCSANSDSFNEGCEEYYNQVDEHDNWESNN